MLNFTFSNPIKIIFGKNKIANLAAEIHKNKRILLTYGVAEALKPAVFITR